MPLQPPNLDDRTYDALLAGAKALIPRYAPEWTDFNESDPGITLLELFAWMTEILLYRLNQVPERNYLKFLQLLGFEQMPAQPARADLSFTLVNNLTDLDSVIVPQGTQVAATASGSGGPLVFETDTALIALNATLKNVQSFDGFSYADETKKNALPGQSFYPFGTTLREGSSALLLGFNSPLNYFTAEQVNLTIYVSTPASKTPTRQCNLDLTTLPAQAALSWEYWNGTQWAPLILDKDETRSFIQNGHIYFRVPSPVDNFKKDQIGIVSDKLFWVRARLVTNQYEMTPQLEMVQINTVGARQEVTVLNEALGASSGEPNQTFSLSQTPVVVRDTPLEQKRADGTVVNVTSLWLEVDEGDGNGPQPWQEVSDFYNSGRDDPHYVLDRTTGVITFGNGTKHGRIPVATVNTAEIIAREYRYGGGAQGNVAAQSITETNVLYVDSVTNIRPAFGGSDEEQLEDAKLRAAADLKSRNRAVTAEDFEWIAKETPGAQIQRAKALPLSHPQFRGQPVPGVVTVIVIPASDSPNPTPSPASLAIVCSYLNAHRLLTSEVYVVPPTYRQVRIEASIIVNPNADLGVVKKAVEDSLNTFFHPLKGGKDGQGWVFGQDIYYSGVYRVVLDIPDVDRLDGDLLIYLDNERQQPYRDVPIGEGNLLSSEQPVIQARYSF